MTTLCQSADGMRSGAELMVSRALVVRWSCAIVAVRLTLRDLGGPGGPARKSGDVGRPVGAPNAAQRIARLTNRGPRPEGFLQRYQHVLRARRSPFELL